MLLLIFPTGLVYHDGVLMVYGKGDGQTKQRIKCDSRLMIIVPSHPLQFNQFNVWRVFSQLDVALLDVALEPNEKNRLIASNIKLSGNIHNWKSTQLSWEPLK